jgi:hypothetical protein
MFDLMNVAQRLHEPATGCVFGLSRLRDCVDGVAYVALREERVDARESRQYTNHMKLSAQDPRER